MASHEARIAHITRLVDKYHTDRTDEKEILQIFESCAASDLNQLLSELPLNKLISSIDDRRFGPKNQTALFDLLRRRHVDFTTPIKFLLLNALQKGGHVRHKEAPIRDLFCSCFGVSLTELKNSLDGVQDHQDLQKLVFDDIRDELLRDELLRHISEQAHAVPRKDVKIISDIDDTLYSSLFDRRYPRGVTYPGLRQLYYELDIGPDEQGREGDVCFITARPTAFFGIPENMTKRMLRSRGIYKSTVLTGDMMHLTGKRIADKKFANFKDFEQLYPEYTFVFFGDSGQADPTFAATMLQQFPARMRAAFIHNIVPIPAADQADFEAKGVFFFSTYVGAAVECYRRGLISYHGLNLVVKSAVVEVKAIVFTTEQQQHTLMELLNADIASANGVEAPVVSEPGANVQRDILPPPGEKALTEEEVTPADAKAISADEVVQE
eukprot:TRINITY_DN14536_c0_g1_i1.p1 TRINITY_DN14536_c0_g1~~TRINITY_DN14536_c0_g1_i1.p1  ORF type:complete len:438 (-),score=100.54 TRINITY_DN14536_c0_g1_i1:102-1415(-)